MGLQHTSCLLLLLHPRRLSPRRLRSQQRRPPRSPLPRRLLRSLPPRSPPQRSLPPRSPQQRSLQPKSQQRRLHPRRSKLIFFTFYLHEIESKKNIQYNFVTSSVNFHIIVI